MFSLSRGAAAGALLGALVAIPSLAAHDGDRPSDHAPIGVMGDHIHDAGEFMLSYRYMRMSMSDALIGSDKVSPETIVTTVPNRFFGRPMQPPTLRVVPTEMTMSMHMLGAMYAPTDRVTLMVMANYLTRTMDHITFAGPQGTDRLGTFRTRSEGFGDTAISALIGLVDKHDHRLLLSPGISLPTGSIGERDAILTPMNTTPTARLPYAMQLGSGTYDLRPRLTYAGNHQRLSWGAQLSAEIRLGDNAAGYSLGDTYRVTGWAGYEPTEWLGLSARLAFQTQDSIDGLDPNIVAPVQTADPDNFGGDRLDALIGVNLLGQSGMLRGHRLAVEAGLPIHQNLNGPQMRTDWTLTVGWQRSF